MSQRFVVTMLEGDLTPRVNGPNKPMGASYHVIDTCVNHRLCATFRAEDQHPGAGTKGGNLPMVQARVQAQAKADARAAALNAKCAARG